MTRRDDIPVTFNSGHALASGFSRDQIRQMVRAGRWTRLRRGQYADAAALLQRDADPYSEARTRHALLACAAADANTASVIGFESAAVIHALPLWEQLPTDVTLVPPAGGWTGRRSGIVFRQATLRAEHVMRKPVMVTTPARTWVDVARAGSLAQALVAGDHGLRAGLLSLDELDRVLTDVGRARGFRRAHLALEHLDARRESPLESASAAYFVLQRVPHPEPQKVFYDTDGRFAGRADFWWREANLIGECDGRLKYRSADDLYAEKRREDRLRALGYQVIRWTAADLRSPDLARRLRTACGLTPAHRVTQPPRK